ncbi:unnamed protein product [Parascedosporium putredinis]|uniref:Chromo domain-containing protein n=1 Tax=Parascedosporium putredinis TaxID=1442378 RepID=A0A9P1MEH9_9PEZI|nr:unnamed protein product [Parascedosporium putredinis]CAI8004682.1 unnamed protein product [Parascedosporium putredinis]
MGEDVFVVEKILGHMVDKEGAISFKVKWEGYEKKADQTWEPEDSLREGAAELLEEYLAARGGLEAIFEETNEAVKTKKRGRKSTGTTPATEPTSKKSKRNGHPAETTPPAAVAKAVAWQPPRDPGRTISKRSTPVKMSPPRCPQKMLRFYENHVRIVKHETAEGADVGSMDAAVKQTSA